MSKIVKPFIAIVFAVVLSISAYAYTFEVDGIYYHYPGGEYRVYVTHGDYDVEGWYSPSYSGAVVIPATVTYEEQTYTVVGIHDNAFYGCENLTSVTLPNTIEEIYQFAFQGCTNLTSITLPNSIRLIEHGAFSSSGLISITIPNGITTIESGTFAGCTSLVYVDLPTSLTNIEWNAFGGCTSLTHIDIPSNVEAIGNSAFFGCTSLTSIILPNITTIDQNMFYMCESLTKVIIPATVTNISYYAFAECFALDSVICLAEVPPTLHNEAFAYLNIYDDIVLQVPCQKIPDYQNATNWNSFRRMIDECGNSNLNNITEEQITIYPNPAKESITLNVEEDVFIFNTLGQIVKQVNTSKGEITISVSDLPNGTYYIKSGDKQQRFIKE